MIEIESFVENLSESSSLKDQIKHIQQFRGLFLKSVSSQSNSIDVLLGVRLLAKFYLHPDYALFRKSVEWIIDVVCTNRSTSKRAIQDALCGVCMNLLGNSEILGVSTDMNIDAATAWALSFTCIAMFDKEYHFLDEYVDSSTDSALMLQLSDTSPLLNFLSVLDTMFAKFSKIVSAKEADSSADTIFENFANIVSNTDKKFRRGDVSLN